MLGLVMPPDYWGVMQLPTIPLGMGLQDGTAPTWHRTVQPSLISAESLVMGARGRPGSGRPEGGVDRPTGGDNGRAGKAVQDPAAEAPLCVSSLPGHVWGCAPCRNALRPRPRTQQAVSASSRSGDDG